MPWITHVKFTSAFARGLKCRIKFDMRCVDGRKEGLIYYVDLHIVVQGEMSVREGHRLSHKVEDEVLRALPQVAEVLVHVEPEEGLTIKTDQKHTP